MTDITEIAGLLIRLGILLITLFLIPYIRSKTTEGQREKIRLYVRMAVQAAEMLFTETGMGQAKKEFVIQYLAEKGFHLDGDELDVYIESAVLELKKSISE